MSVVVRADGLCKSYWIRGMSSRGWRRSVERRVLDDISFEVSEGEVFGIIGRNGAGKSTLLKIFSRITAPTGGTVAVAGRLASLLEVGTGMHPEMTGRENIYLNGALLGMSKADIRAKIDEIVAFAGVEDYIETPIKRYSSGMRLRLAFAVAAHLSADIMIVDEVLAVGDADFQAKCLGVLQQGIRSGRTTLFVSHNMPTIEHICSRVMWLESGRIAKMGSAGEVVSHYLRHTVSAGGAVQTIDRGPASALAPARIVRAEVAGGNGPVIEQGEDVIVSLDVEVAERVRGFQVFLNISTIEGESVATTSNGDYKNVWELEPGTYAITACFSNARLLPRAYRVSVRTGIEWGREVFENLPDVIGFTVTGRDVLGTGVSLLADRGVTWLPAEFSIAQRTRSETVA